MGLRLRPLVQTGLSARFVVAPGFEQNRREPQHPAEVPIFLAADRYVPCPLESPPVP
jgi:hypothetical protein